MTEYMETPYPQWFSDDMAQNLSKATRLKAKVYKIYKEIDRLCEPFAFKLQQEIESSDVSEREKLDGLARMLPDDFYRVELRTLLVKKFGK